mgnify:CR=1 FL=1
MANLPLLAEMKNDDTLCLQSLQTLKTWAESKQDGGYHHVVIIGMVSRIQVESGWLQDLGYTLEPKGDSRSNLAYWHKKYDRTYPGVSIYHMIHLNGSWVLNITPKNVQQDPERMIRYAADVLKASFREGVYFHVVVRRFEASRADSDQVLQWMKAQNIKEIKCYVHDSYEARVEVTYLDPAFSPRTSRLLAELG